jgi:hypothetical protein
MRCRRLSSEANRKQDQQTGPDKPHGSSGKHRHFDEFCSALRDAKRLSSCFDVAEELRVIPSPFFNVLPCKKTVFAWCETLEAKPAN